jgi:hypothetical protein
MTSDDTGKEHDDPEKWCRAPLCKNTNWGGYNRLHIRGSECPPYDPNPEPNHIAELWEGVRQVARDNADRMRREAPRIVAAVRRLHVEYLPAHVDFTTCAHCNTLKRFPDIQPWPCPTIMAMTDAVAGS